MKKKVCFVTGSRAEFGLLKHLIADSLKQSSLHVQLVATGSHLSKRHGETVREIVKAGFFIDEVVDMELASGSAVDVSRSVGKAIAGFGEALNRLRPDLVLILGDRYELLGPVIAALMGGIPVAHLHGGERSEGAFDEAIRHAVTKMSHLHFVSNEVYRQRVIQLGEEPHRVFNVGGLGVDAISRTPLLNKAALESLLNLSFGHKNLLVTYHPVTNVRDQNNIGLDNLLSALAELEDTCIIFTMPNADVGNVPIADRIKTFSDNHPNTHLFDSLGQVNYLSALQFVDGVVGNSSSGLAEAPSFGIGTINIGDRQQGRLMAESVITCSDDLSEIRQALKRLYAPSFRARLPEIMNPYGDGGASAKIIEILCSFELEGLLKKSFFDINVQSLMAESS